MTTETVDWAEALAAYAPGTAWTLRNNNFDTLEWKESSPAPTRQQVKQHWHATADQRHNNVQRERRLQAFKVEADPLYFKWQRNEAAKEVWLDKVDEIRRRFPYAGEAG